MDCLIHYTFFCVYMYFLLSVLLQTWHKTQQTIRGIAAHRKKTKAILNKDKSNNKELNLKAFIFGK